MLRLWKLAWPMMVLGASRVAMRTIDLLVVGFLGSWAVASVGLGDVWLRMVLFVGLGLGAGTVARVSQGEGAGDARQVEHAMAQSTLIALLVGGVASCVFWLTGHRLIAILGAEPRVVQQGGWYLRLVGLTAMPRIFYLVTLRGMAAVEDTISPMWIGFVTTLINIAASVVLVFGYLGFPALGVIGAGLGTMIGNVLAGGICLVFLLHPGYPLGFRRTGWIDWTEGLRIVRIGVPGMANGGIVAVARLPFSAMLLWFGNAAVGAFQIARRVQMLAMMPNWGISAAAGTYSGQHLGQGEPDRARDQGWLAVRLSLLISGPVALLLVLLRYQLAFLFIREEPAMTMTAHFILVYGLAMVLFSITRNLAGSLAGAGQTLVPMLATGAAMSVLLSGTYVFCGPLGYGMVAVYGSILASYLVRMLIVGGFFLRYRWGRHPAVLRVEGSS